MRPWNGNHEDEVLTTTTRANKLYGGSVFCHCYLLLPQQKNGPSCESAEKARHQNNRSPAYYRHCDSNNRLLLNSNHLGVQTFSSHDLECTSIGCFARAHDSDAL